VLTPHHCRTAGPDHIEAAKAASLQSLTYLMQSPTPSHWSSSVSIHLLTPSYSEEHKYRPAASPVITEYLKDGRIRLRGASPGGVGVREEDLPMSKERKAVQEKKRVEEAKAAAAKKLKEKRQAIKEKRSARKAKKRGGKAAGKSEI